MRKLTKTAVVFLSVFVSLVLGACGSEPTQKDGQKGGSAPQGDGQAAAASGDVKTTSIGRPPQAVYGSSYVAPMTEVFGDVVIGQRDFVASNTVMRAAPGERVELGDEANVQDNVVVRARTDTVTIGDRSSLTHHAIVKDSDVGSSVFVGYDVEILDSKVGDGAFIYHGALIDGVDIPEESFVGPGEVVSDQAAADALPKVDDVDLAKYYDKKDHLDANLEFAKAYIDLYEEEGYDGVLEVGPNPKTSWNQEQVEPQVGENVELQEFARVVGDVRIGDNSSVGRRTAIRADEGNPVSIGPGAVIDDRVTFHSTRDAQVEVRKNLVAGDDAVLHGPLEMGDDAVVGEGAVVFRVRVGDNVQIGEGALIAGPSGEEITLEIPDGAVIPVGATITSEKDVQALGG